MAHPNHEILRRIQDRYIDNPEDDDYILVDDLDEYVGIDEVSATKDSGGNKC